MTPALLTALILSSSTTDAVDRAVRAELTHQQCTMSRQDGRRIFFSCVRTGWEGHVNLENLDSQWDRLSGREREDLVTRWIAGASPAGAATPERWELHVRPMIKRAADVDAMFTQLPEMAHGKVRLPANSISKELRLIVVMDSEHHTTWVTTLNLDAWKTDIQRVAPVAEKNLAEIAFKFEQITLAQKHLALRLSTLDGYDATRVVLASAQREAARLLGGPVAWALPRRDLLVATRADQPEAIKALRGLARTEFAREYPLSTEVFVVRPGGLVEVPEP